jgi:hypothetical protein
MKPACLLLFVAGLCCQAATYYVDSARGSDANSGTSRSVPWKTLDRVNTASFQPGDRILFRSGSDWRGQLAPRSSGAEGAPVVIDRYGAGARPHIDGAGQVEDAIRLYNVQFIEVRNLEVTNHGPAPAVRRGVHIFLDNFGVGTHIVVAGLYIHDVNGTNQRKDNGGIIFRTRGNEKPSRFDGLTIERNIVWKVDRSAIAAQSYHAMRRHWFPSQNVVIRDNFVDDVGGDGIVPWATESVLVEHNIARNCNRRAGSYNAGIWPWSADNSLFQLNEASLTRTTMDGEGFDSDYNSRNTLFQYNYSHDNEGGFMLVCTPGRRNPQDNIGNTGTIIRNNISRNDHARIFHISGGNDVTIQDNAIYVGPSLDVQLLLLSEWEGWAVGVVFRHNWFNVEGMARYGQGVRRPDGSYELQAGTGGAKAISFTGNIYQGRNEGRFEDATAVVKDHPDAAKLNWDAPQFDPARPDTFDSFLRKHRQWMLRLFQQQFGKPVKLGR